MNVIVFLDDGRGMMFNYRRQSRDKALEERIREICRGHRLWLNAYSYKLYSEAGDVRVSEKFLEEAGEGDFCLVESELLKPAENRIDKLIVFWWNRKYPADLKLDLNLEDWVLVSSNEFPGFSHDKITEEVYARKGKAYEEG